MAKGSGTQAARPLVQAFLICQEVFKDFRTGKFIILAPTIHLNVAQFPCQVAVMGFLQMVEAHGQYHFAAELADPDDEVVWRWTAGQPLYHPDPLAPHQVIFHDWVLKVPRPGRYRLTVSGNGAELVGQTLCLGPLEFFLAQR